MLVTVWNEGRVEAELDIAAQHYPEGMHTVVTSALREHGLDARPATLDEPEQGLSPARLDVTDVLVWWGHRAHDEVSDALVARIAQRVHDGMGFVALHSAHFSKPFLGLLGTSGRLRWRHGDRERIWIVAPEHPIAAGLPEAIDVGDEEMYGEPFDVPTPDEVVAISWFGGGEVLRSVCTWRRGSGRVVYVRPGDEHHPTYHHRDVQQLLANAVRWAGSAEGR